MKPFTPVQERVLLGLAIFGFLVPNGFFLYFAAAEPEWVDAALENPISLVFIVEAFFLMFLFAWLIHREGLRSPGWITFVALSILGSLWFSVPAFLYLASRSHRRSGAA